MTGEARGGIRHWLVRGALVLIGLELAWLLLVNLVLALPATQEWLDTLRPDRVQLSWRSARSWYPGHVDVHGAVVSGQTPRLQWQAEADRVRGNVALLPLFLRRVVVTRARAENGRYRQRPRLEAGEDPGDAPAHFPDIRGYEPTPRGALPKPRGRPWTTSVRGARLEGRHHAWLGRIQAQGTATAEADLTVRSEGGPVELDVRNLAMDLDRAWADDDVAILDDGRFEGKLHLGPYGYREHRGLDTLRFLDLDLDLTLSAEDLSFVRLFLLAWPDLEVGGRGRAEGRIAMRTGRVTSGTDVRIGADSLSVAQAPFAAAGDGDVRLISTDDGELPFRVTFGFADLDVLHYDDRSLFFTGRGLRIQLENRGNLLPAGDGEGVSAMDFRATLNVPKALVDDARTFNRYLPPASPLTFTGGTADLEANLVLSPGDADGSFTLRGEALRARLDDQDLGLGLRVAGVVAGGTPAERRFDLAGSRLTLDRARVVGGESRLEGADWSATALLEQAELVLERPVALMVEADLAISDTRPLAAMFLNQGGPAWIAQRLTMQDISGVARLRLQDERLYVPDARLGTEDLTVGMRGVIREPAGEGMFYLRYKALDAGLRFGNGERDLILFGPREAFDDYQVNLPRDP